MTAKGEGCAAVKLCAVGDRIDDGIHIGLASGGNVCLNHLVAWGSHIGHVVP